MNTITAFIAHINLSVIIDQQQNAQMSSRKHVQRYDHSYCRKEDLNTCLNECLLPLGNRCIMYSENWLRLFL